MEGKTRISLPHSCFFCECELIDTNSTEMCLRRMFSYLEISQEETRAMGGGNVMESDKLTCDAVGAVENGKEDRSVQVCGSCSFAAGKFSRLCELLELAQLQVNESLKELMTMTKCSTGFGGIQGPGWTINHPSEETPVNDLRRQAKNQFMQLLASYKNRCGRTMEEKEEEGKKFSDEKAKTTEQQYLKDVQDLKNPGSGQLDSFSDQSHHEACPSLINPPTQNTESGDQSFTGMDWEHSPLREPKMTESNYNKMCPECGESFQTANEMYSHIKFKRCVKTASNRESRDAVRYKKMNKASSVMNTSGTQGTIPGTPRNTRTSTKTRSSLLPHIISTRSFSEPKSSVLQDRKSRPPKLQEPTFNEIFPCTFCTKKLFTNKAALDNHIKTSHSRKKASTTSTKYQCFSCKKDLKSNRNYLHHNARHHPEEFFTTAKLEGISNESFKLICHRVMNKEQASFKLLYKLDGKCIYDCFYCGDQFPKVETRLHLVTCHDDILVGKLEKLQRQKS